MKLINTASYSDHEELSQLLPWYVNKSLQGTELKAVEEHLKVCLVCKRELMQHQRLAQLTVSSHSIDTAENASFSRLKKRLHTSQTLPQHEPNIGAVSPAGNVLAFSKAKKKNWLSISAMRPALAMAAALLLSLTVLLPRYMENDARMIGNFRTLSSDAQLPTVKSNEIRVVFADNVSQQQKDKVLEKVHGRFIDNTPTAQGVYSVRLDNDIAESHLLDVIDLLRKDKSVVFAEPAYALLSSSPTED